MIEARNFYWKEVTEGEPRSTHGEKGEGSTSCVDLILAFIYGMFLKEHIRLDQHYSPGQYGGEQCRKKGHYHILRSLLGHINTQHWTFAAT